VQCYFENNKDAEAAESVYKELVRKGVAHKYSRFDKVLNYKMEKWVRDSSVQNRPHSHCEPAVEDEVIQQFALKLGSGHAIPIYSYVGLLPVVSWEHRPYYTLAEAAAADPYIRSVVSSHSDKAALLHRAKTLMPQLHYGFKHIKREPSPELKQRRMAYDARMLQRIAADPECLWNVFSEDEFTKGGDKSFCKNVCFTQKMPQQGNQTFTDCKAQSGQQ
jgi:hypothetical protein